MGSLAAQLREQDSQLEVVGRSVGYMQLKNL